MSNALRRDGGLWPLEATLLQSDDGFDATRCTFGEAGSSDAAKCWADSTLRSRECRMRKRLGLGIRPVRITRKQATKLVELGYLSLDRKGDAAELCVMGLPGKPDGMDGSEVARYHCDGRIQDIAEYCETDVVNTYRVWLRYELFRGKLTEKEMEASEANLTDYIKAHSNTKTHLIQCCAT